MTSDSPNNPHNQNNPSPAAPGAPAPSKTGLMRSIGQFAGHLFTSVKHDPSEMTTTTQQTSKAVEEHITTDEQGRSVTLRRTTIEEVEFNDPD